MNNLYFLMLLLAFAAAVTFAVGAYMAWDAVWGPEARRTAERLRAISAGEGDGEAAPLLRQRRMSDIPVVEKVLLSLPRIHALDRFVVQSGLRITVAVFVGLAFVLAIAVFVLVRSANLPAHFAIVAAAAAVACWFLFVQYRRAKRMRTIDGQLPDILDLMARAMQAGHAFSSSLRLAATEGPQPIAGEFQITFDEINYGMPLSQAIQNLAARVESDNLRFFVVSVMIQQETGGNLADILISIAALIRERQNLAARIRVLSAEGRISAWVLVLLPFALGFIVWLLNPPFIALLWTDPVGLRVLFFVLCLMAAGGWWMRQMVHFRT